MRPEGVIVSIEDASVHIPLRGLKKGTGVVDDRIFQRDDGVFVFEALKGISLTVHRGERIGIVGGNGNGKTTLLKLLGGMLPAASGSVKVYGSMRTILSVGAGTIPALSGRQNVVLRYSLLEVRTVSVESYVSDVEEFSDLGIFFDMPVGTYSPGMLSRLQFAMSTVEPANILLLDEWIGVADQSFQEKAKIRLEKYINSYDAFLFASHSSELIRSMTDRVITISRGQLVDV